MVSFKSAIFSFGETGLLKMLDYILTLLIVEKKGGEKEGGSGCSFD